MRRNTPIPEDFQPGDDITQSMLNRIVDGANTGRVITGTGINITESGGNIALNVPPATNRAGSVLVYVKTDSFTSGDGYILPGGVYFGKLFSQQTVLFDWASGDSSITQPNLSPNNVNCYVINLSEQGSSGLHAFMNADFIAEGFMCRNTSGSLCVAINKNPVQNLGEYKITAVSGSFPQWTYTCQKVISYDASLTNAARYVTDGSNVTAQNTMEQSGTATYTYPTGLSITDAGTGAVNSTACLYQPIGVGAVVTLYSIPKSDYSGLVYVFSAENSAQ